MARRPPRAEGERPALTRERVLAAIEANKGALDKNGIARVLGVSPD